MFSRTLSKYFSIPTEHFCYNTHNRNTLEAPIVLVSYLINRENNQYGESVFLVFSIALENIIIYVRTRQNLKLSPLRLKYSMKE